ncbi:MAG: TonB-dependent receptor plug domain-containing protein [Alistipes shahii]
MSGLSGQVAGLSVAKANTGGGGSMRVTLRGESSIDLNNNGALFVIDGVPMFNTLGGRGRVHRLFDRLTATARATSTPRTSRTSRC